MRTNPDITVPANSIHWFNPWRPADVLGPCPHLECEHDHYKNVIAWGPDETRYELVECVEENGGCGCRAWNCWKDKNVLYPISVVRLNWRFVLP